ncbi:MAG: hypothetical protein J5705_05890 [Bacteroidaceae bacterium]|nr:hypothetical protein [Bacteroidaceae bacterium]
MGHKMDGTEPTGERKATKGCRIGCLSMLAFFTALIYWIAIGQSPSNYLTYRMYRPDKKNNNIEEVTGIRFPSFKLLSQKISDNSIVGGLYYDAKLEFDEVPNDGFYQKLDSLCELGVITGPARHENKKRWKLYDVSYNPGLTDEYFFKLILRNRRNIHRIIYYTIAINRGQKEWRMRICDSYEAYYSESELRID